jgi:hypothetical protein
MKFLTVLALFLSLSAHAYTYKCTENVEGTTRQPKLSVTIEELAEVTDEVTWSSHYDHVYKVRITLTKSNKRTRFDAFSTSEDVYYTISSVKANGFKFHLYLDEHDQAGVELTADDGTKKKYSLICE